MRVTGRRGCPRELLEEEAAAAGPQGVRAVRRARLAAQGARASRSGRQLCRDGSLVRAGDEAEARELHRSAPGGRRGREKKLPGWARAGGAGRRGPAAAERGGDTVRRAGAGAGSRERERGRALTGRGGVAAGSGPGWRRLPSRTAAAWPASRPQLPGSATPGAVGEGRGGAPGDRLAGRRAALPVSGRAGLPRPWCFHHAREEKEGRADTGSGRRGGGGSGRRRGAGGPADRRASPRTSTTSLLTPAPPRLAPPRPAWPRPRPEQAAATGKTWRRSLRRGSRACLGAGWEARRGWRVTADGRRRRLRVTCEVKVKSPTHTSSELLVLKNEGNYICED